MHAGLGEGVCGGRAGEAEPDDDRVGIPLAAHGAFPSAGRG